MNTNVWGDFQICITAPLTTEKDGIHDESRTWNPSDLRLGN